jgi:hypothetical protein
VVTIFGTTYYTIGAGLLMLALLAPLFYLFARWLLRPNVEDEPRRKRLLAEGGLTLGLLLIAAVALHWDVYLIGQRAKVLCEQTGLVIHGLTRATGLAGTTDIQFWSRFGVTFVEDELDGKRLRISLEGTQEIRTPIASYRSELALISSTDYQHHQQQPERLALSRHVDEIRDIRTGRLLGQLTEYTVPWGWVDRSVIELTGFSATPRICGKDNQGKVTTEDRRVGLAELADGVLIR